VTMPMATLGVDALAGGGFVQILVFLDPRSIGSVGETASV